MGLGALARPPPPRTHPATVPTPPPSQAFTANANELSRRLGRNADVRALNRWADELFTPAGAPPAVGAERGHPLRQLRSVRLIPPFVCCAPFPPAPLPATPLAPLALGAIASLPRPRSMRSGLATRPAGEAGAPAGRKGVTWGGDAGVGRHGSSAGGARSVSRESAADADAERGRGRGVRRALAGARGEEVEDEDERMEVTDAGVDFNLPLPALLRRAVDLVFVHDARPFAGAHPDALHRSDDALRPAAEWARAVAPPPLSPPPPRAAP